MDFSVLIIAASDPSGGAGIEADIKTATAHGVYAMTALTALTVQDTRGVREVSATPLRVFRDILELHKNDLPINAIKTGALADADHAKAVHEFLSSLFPLPPLVLDPVAKASSGDPLIDMPAVKVIIESLLPMATIVTPNLAEAALLTGFEVKDRASMKKAALELCRLGARAALIKGGHLEGESRDVLCHDGEVKEFVSERLPHEFHGTGCVLASAIASRIALGHELTDAVSGARGYLAKCMRGARPGSAASYVLDFPGAV